MTNRIGDLAGDDDARIVMAQGRARWRKVVEGGRRWRKAVEVGRRR